jgi:hypothetical protein
MKCSNGFRLLIRRPFIIGPASNTSLGLVTGYFALPNGKTGLNVKIVPSGFMEFQEPEKQFLPLI